MKQLALTPEWEIEVSENGGDTPFFKKYSDYIGRACTHLVAALYSLALADVTLTDKLKFDIIVNMPGGQLFRVESKKVSSSGTVTPSGQWSPGARKKAAKEFKNATHHDILVKVTLTRRLLRMLAEHIELIPRSKEGLLDSADFQRECERIFQENMGEYPEY